MPHEPQESQDKLRATLVRAAREVERLRNKVGALESAATEPIAVIGLGLRLPGGVTDIDSLWKLLESQTDTVASIPSERWPADEVYNADPDAPGKTYVREAAFISDLDLFDPAFFKISPREAESLDPQHRLLLETSWQALEHARIIPAALASSRTGVYVGVGPSDYALLHAHSDSDGYTATGTHTSFAAGRIAYHLGLQGPAISIDTACSSSLVALHLACKTLRVGECDLALAAGVQALLGPAAFVALARLHALAPDGRSKTFSANADGYGRGEGVVVLALERLSDATANGRRILALVRGSAVNHDGMSSGITAPNGTSQQKVLRAALDDARLQPADVDFVECHGTGTKLGDPIEVQALAAVYGQGRPDDAPLLLGAIKTNIGHLESAAGLAGVAKVIAAMNHGALPASIHTRPRNPHIDWDNLAVEVVDELLPWRRGAADRPLRAGVSSFGLSGTNAHVILEEASALDLSARSDRVKTTEQLPLVLSARNEASLVGQARKLREYVEARPDVATLDLAFSLATTRSHFEHRACVVAPNRKVLAQALDAIATRTPHSAYVDARAKAQGKVVFVFPGQGSQWADMAKVLLAQSPVFRATIEACSKALAPHTDWSLLSVLLGEPESADLERVDVVQPTLFAMMVALAALWGDLGVVPDAVVGHSQGEIAAAYVAGALSLEDAAKVVALRSRVIAQQLGAGAMAAVSLPADELAPHLWPYGDRLALAVDNGPSSTAISGDPEAIEEIVAALESEGIFARRIRVTYASHCAHIETIRQPLLDALSSLSPRPARIPMLSSVCVEALEGTELDAEYWYRNLRQRVRFAEATDALLDSGHSFFVEISPHPVLPLAVSGILDAHGHAGAVVGTLRRDQGNIERVLLSLGELHCHGYNLDWSKLFAQHHPQCVDLPTYVFDRQRHWLPEGVLLGGTRGVLSRAPSIDGHPLLGRQFHMSTLAGTTFWERELAAGAPAWLTDHRVEEACVFPGTGFAELALAAARESSNSSALVLEQLEFRRALVLRDHDPVSVQVALTDAGIGSWHVTISEAVGNDWLVLASTRVSLAQEPPSSYSPASHGTSLAALRERHHIPHAASDFYSFVGRMGLNYGPAFQGIESLWLAPDGASVLARVKLPETGGKADAFFVHPALLDACFQVSLATMLGVDAEHGPLVPVLVERILLAGPLGGGPLWCAASTHTDDSGNPIAELSFWNDEGTFLGLVQGLHSERLDHPTPNSDPFGRALLDITWQQLSPVPVITETAERILVLADHPGVTERLRRLLEADDVTVRAVHDLDPFDQEGIKAVLDDALREPLAAILCLWSLDAPEVDGLPSDALLEPTRAGWGGALNVVKSLVSRSLRDPPRLVLVTHRSQSHHGTTRTRPEQALTWGLGGTIRSEHPSLRPLRVDLSELDSVDELSVLIALALSDTDEDQVVLHGKASFAARLEHAVLPTPARFRPQRATDHAYRLEVETPGALDSLHLIAFDRQEPTSDEVEIAVEAAGLNFRDVLLATGVVPPIGDSRVRLGFECAGTISRVGPNSRGLEVGQRVVAITADGFGTHVLANADRVFSIPDDLSFADAATLPIGHISAYYSLRHVAKLAPAERVLIHSAAGGVGLAALQWAKHIGAEIYATAGNEAKRAWLREQGIAHVSDSRSLRFVEDVTLWSKGEGVDVVLNALSGELMHKSLGLLRPGGRFVELGLRDALSNNQLGLMPFARGLSYTLVNVGEMVLHSFPRVREVFLEILDHVATGVLTALPRHDAPLSQASDVFWEMGRGRHIGKFVLTIDEPEPPAIAVPVDPRTGGVSSEASYIITGGLGGLGLSLAGWMADQGAGHLVLLGRRGVTDNNQRGAIAAMQAKGARVTVTSVDVADLSALEAVVATIPEGLPLRGVVHAAGLLDDAMLINQDLESFARVMSPKVGGAWNLHLLTKDLDLDFFVLYSSAAAVFGTPGQGNYVAANAFLDSLAHHRRSLGLPALSLGWGPFSDVGLAAAEDVRGARLSGRGIQELSPADGVHLFSRLVASSLIHVAPCPIDIQQWIEFYPEAAGWPFLTELLAAAPHADSAGASDFLASLKTSSTATRRILLLNLVLDELAKVIRMNVTEIDPETPFSDLGVDSLMGIELRNRIKTHAGIELPSTAIWTYPTATALGDYLVSQLIIPPTSDSSTHHPISTPDVETVSPADLDLDDDDDLLGELEELEGLLDV